MKDQNARPKLILKLNGMLTNLIKQEIPPKQKIFSEFFRDWNTTGSISNKLYPQKNKDISKELKEVYNKKKGKKTRGRMIPIVSKYFNDFKNKGYLDTRVYKNPETCHLKSGEIIKRTRAIIQHRANLKAFYEYVLSEKPDGIKFTDEEKNFIEFCFELPGMRNIPSEKFEESSVFECIKNKLIEFFILGLDTIDSKENLDFNNLSKNFVKELLNKKEINAEDVEAFKKFVEKIWSNENFPDIEYGYKWLLISYADDLDIFDKINLLIPSFYRKLIHFPLGSSQEEDKQLDNKEKKDRKRAD